MSDRSIFEAEAVAAGLRAAGHMSAFERAMGEAINALAASGDPRERDCHRVVEISRLAGMRLQHVLRSLGEKGGDE